MPRQAPRVPADFHRATRWDTTRVLGELREVEGVELADEGRCRGGQIGAAYVRWPDGHRSVLTCRPWGSQPADDSALIAARQAGQLIDVARRGGIPAPRYELVARLPVGIAIVQELLPGSPPATVTRQTIESMIEINGLCRGLLADRDDLPAPALFLLTDGPGFCLHKPMAVYDVRTARLLRAIEDIGASVPAVLPGADLVHFDFHLENVLVDGDGGVTGVVDWDGSSRGDATMDLITLRFDLAWRAPELGRWLDTRLAGNIPGDVARACWAHMSLRLVDWAIREHGPSEVTTWVGVATELMP